MEVVDTNSATHPPRTLHSYGQSRDFNRCGISIVMEVVDTNSATHPPRTLVSYGQSRDFNRCGISIVMEVVDTNSATVQQCNTSTPHPAFIRSKPWPISLPKARVKVGASEIIHIDARVRLAVKQRSSCLPLPQ
jgi:hypothetical protein